MVLLIALVGAAVIALVLWRVMNAPDGEQQAPRGPLSGPIRPAGPPRVSGPDDDPDFLRQLDEKARRPDDPDTA